LNQPKVSLPTQTLPLGIHDIASIPPTVVERHPAHRARELPKTATAPADFVSSANERRGKVLWRQLI
jgi:hypothetical protein